MAPSLRSSLAQMSHQQDEVGIGAVQRATRLFQHGVTAITLPHFLPPHHLPPWQAPAASQYHRLHLHQARRLY